MQLRRTHLPLLIAPFALIACSVDEDDGAFVIQTTAEAVSSVAPVVVRGDWLVYLASESMTGMGGTMLNGDGDVTDNVAFAVNMVSRSSNNTGAAAFLAEIVGSDIYLAVRESDDDVDWNMSGTIDAADFVLLHWSLTSGVLTFVDSLDISSTADPAFVTAGGRLYYSRTDAPVLADESSLRYVDAASPMVSMPVFNPMGEGMSDPEVVFVDEGLVFLVLDEIADAVDYNGDGDTTDPRVLALLDGTDEASLIQNTSLAIPSASGPFDAFANGVQNWVVAFLVDENAQGMTNFNDPALFNNPLLPPSCSADDDEDDDILFFLEFQSFSMGTPPENTGIPGNDRVLAWSDFVATLSDEDAGACDLNEDGDLDDTMVRWTRTLLPVLPSRNPTNMRAVETNLPGGAMGVAILEGVIVAAIDEMKDSEDINMRGGRIDDLVGWVDPTAGSEAVWTFQHQAPSPFDTFGTAVFGPSPSFESEPFAGASWMAAEETAGRLGIAFQERVPCANPGIATLNVNLSCNFFMKDSDSLDSLPIWADLPSAPGFGRVLDFDGVGYAIDAADAGLVVARGFAFFRVNEAADSRDYNNDGVANDFVLFRNPLTACTPVPMATSSNVDGPVIFTDGVRGAAFLSSEAQAGLDFNGDGDQVDLVIRYFLL